jgi:hypothetical protein
VADNRFEPNRWIEAAKIVGLCILSSIFYGIAHDQITARVYLPYFTDWPPHAGVVASTDPSVVGLVWGIIATWWVGLILGIPLAYVATSGDRRILPWQKLVAPLATVLGISFAAAMLGLALSLATGFSVDHWIAGPAVEVGANEDLKRFSAVLVAHNVSYALGIVGGALLILFVLMKRRKIVCYQ